ncbi:hypothetical protein C4552_05015 [Candidatus Parcubacteria bacterium]|nr:MAG: hypothetical protein C4552_05015 [Candidatus Parcubacteria bacterium]
MFRVALRRQQRELSMKKSRKVRGKTFIVLGISGSGKDTQAQFLLKAIGGHRLSTGDGLRAMAKKKNMVGRYVARALKRGGLLPAWAPIYLWLFEFINDLEGDESVIFTSGPRRVEEAQLLDVFCHDLGRAAPVAIHLALPIRVARERLMARRRGDDTPQAIEGRLRFYEEHVRDVIAYFRRKGRLISINGNQSMDAVWRDIKKALKIR